MGRLFGTDGVRGIANTELTCELAMNIGKAAAMVLINEDVKHPVFLIGKDTRISCSMIESALIAGLSSVGANVKLLGVVPTPTVPYLINKYNAHAGIMISASHNSYEFNGIKLFNNEGYKLSDQLEEEIEEIVLDNKIPYTIAENDNLGLVETMYNAVDEYIDHVVDSVPYNLKGMKIAIDCANGSASTTARKLFTKLEADFHIMNDKPNGININDNCGSTHMDGLIKYVKENNCDAGLAFDGDADRCLAVCDKGNLIDGDYILAICAADLKSRNLLKKDAVVGTIMTNMGFEKFCNINNMKFIATQVGDRYVLEEMLKEGYNLGGEQSGHLIYLDYGTTGDGQLTGAHILSIVNRRQGKLSSLATLMERFPQTLVNVKITNEGKKQLKTDEDIKKVIENVKETLGNSGRIIVRASGTEPLVRVMLEGEDLEEIKPLTEEVAKVIKEKLGK